MVCVCRLVGDLCNLGGCDVSSGKQGRVLEQLRGINTHSRAAYRGRMVVTDFLCTTSNPSSSVQGPRVPGGSKASQGAWRADLYIAIKTSAAAQEANLQERKSLLVCSVLRPLLLMSLWPGCIVFGWYYEWAKQETNQRSRPFGKGNLYDKG